MLEKRDRKETDTKKVIRISKEGKEKVKDWEKGSCAVIEVEKESGKT